MLAGYFVGTGLVVDETNNTRGEKITIEEKK
jgi:hypothetical protein